MQTIPGKTCAICGLPASLHMTVVDESGGAQEQFLCFDHIPADVRDSMPQTPEAEIALLLEKLKLLDQNPMPPDIKSQARAHLQHLIDEIKAGRQRLYD